MFPSAICWSNRKKTWQSRPSKAGKTVVNVCHFFLMFWCYSNKIQFNIMCFFLFYVHLYACNSPDLFDYFLCDWRCSARSRCVSMVTKRCCGSLRQQTQDILLPRHSRLRVKIFVITCKLSKTSVLCKLYQGWPNKVSLFQTGIAGHEWIH